MAGFGPRLSFFFCVVLGVRVSGAPKTFFSPSLITGLEKESQGSSLCIHCIYSFFQKEVAVLRLRWHLPFVDLKRHNALLLQEGQKEQRGELA